MNDARFMRLALRLAAKGRTSPNPRVGAVVVRDGEILAAGYHRAAGQPHAEVEALSKLEFKAEGTTLYVNLEPCSHFGRTPPCTDAILRAGVREVVAGMVDPNPLVEGRGFEKLRAAGVTVRSGVLEAACRRLNEGFVKAITTGLPFVTLKVAATADGRTATRTGASRWITSPEARRYVHRLRAECDAVLVGVGTVLADDPRLTVRLERRRESRQPLRVVLDSRLRSPLEARVFDREAPTLVITTGQAPEGTVQALRERGVAVEFAPAVDGRLDLVAAMQILSRRGVVYVLAEPGAELASGLAMARLVDRYLFFYAPKLFAGVAAPGMLGGTGVAAVDDAMALSWEEVRRIGPDLMATAVPAPAAGAAVVPGSSPTSAAETGGVLEQLEPEAFEAARRRAGG